MAGCGAAHNPGDLAQRTVSGTRGGRLRRRATPGHSLRSSGSLPPGGRAKILVCVADATYAAYNFWGGRSLYGFTTRGMYFWSYGPSLDPYRGHYQTPRAFRVALGRPVPRRICIREMAAVGSASIRWLARHGIEVELCTRKVGLL